jgi:hypothetical protein
MPEELWAIQCKPSDNLKCHFCPPLDDDGTDVLLAWPSREQAEKGLSHQINMGYFEESEVEIVCLFSKHPEPASVAGGGE